MISRKVTLSKSKYKKILPLGLLILIFFSVINLFSNQLSYVLHKIAHDNNGWNLILVNREYYIPKNYKVDLIRLSNGVQVDPRIYPELQEMLDAARGEGVDLFIAAGYRTESDQEKILQNKIAEFQEEGYSKKSQ